jgi:hypothetical protein
MTTIRITLRVGVGLLLAGAVWLYAIRGEAILMDLQTMSARMLCL